MKLLIISIGAVLFTFALLFMARIWGLGQGYQAFAHPFFSSPKMVRAVRVTNLKDAEYIEKKDNAAIFWLDLGKTLDGHFLILDKERKVLIPPEMVNESYRGDHTFYYDLKTLRAFYDREPLLEEFLTRFPKSRFILNLIDNAPNIHTEFIKTIQDAKAESRILVQGDAEIVLRAVKDLQPMWIYGTTRSDIMRLLSFDSLYILPAAPFMGDVFVSPIKVLNRPAFNGKILQEIRRRQKKILLGPLTTDTDFNAARGLPTDGYIYDNSVLFLKDLDQNPAQ